MQKINEGTVKSVQERFNVDKKKCHMGVTLLTFT